MAEICKESIARLSEIKQELLDIATEFNGSDSDACDVMRLFMAVESVNTFVEINLAARTEKEIPAWEK